jgi:hypothetical protein
MASTRKIKVVGDAQGKPVDPGSVALGAVVDADGNIELPEAVADDAIARQRLDGKDGRHPPLNAHPSTIKSFDNDPCRWRYSELEKDTPPETII